MRYFEKQSTIRRGVLNPVFNTLGKAVPESVLAPFSRHGRLGRLSKALEEGRSYRFNKAYIPKNKVRPAYNKKLREMRHSAGKVVAGAGIVGTAAAGTKLLSNKKEK